MLVAYYIIAYLVCFARLLLAKYVMYVTCLVECFYHKIPSWDSYITCNILYIQVQNVFSKSCKRFGLTETVYPSSNVYRSASTYNLLYVHLEKSF